MIEFGKNERVDWFQMFVDLERKGFSLEAVSRLVNIPRTTLHDYKQDTSRPKFEEGLRIIALWALKTGNVHTSPPRYDPFKPHLRGAKAQQ